MKTNARPFFWWLLGGSAVAFLLLKRTSVEEVASEAVQVTEEAVNALVTWARTNDKTIDAEIGPRVSVLAAKYIPEASQGPAVTRALMAIVNNEYARYLPADRQVGDMSLSGGPSVGPMQVYRRTAIDMGFVPANISKEDYATYAYDLDTVLMWGVKVFREKLRMAKGDVSLAIKYYNGSGAGADAYRAKALAFIQRVWGSLYG